MKLLKSFALAATVALAGAGSAFAAVHETTVTRVTPHGTVTRHIVRHDEPRMKRVRVVRRVVWVDHHGNRHVRKVITWRLVPARTAHVINRHVVVRHYG
jgi:hypothetical protein